MSTTLDNGVIVPINSDAYAPTADMATMGNSTKVITPVASQAARDALTTFTHRLVMRTDLQSTPIFRYDGSAWQQITGLRHAEYTGPAFTTSAGTGTNFSNGTGGTALAADASKTFNNTFVQPDVGGRVKILEAGVYALSGIILPTSVPASYSLQIVDVTNGVRLGGNSGVGYGDKEQNVAVPNVYLAVNTVVEFTVVTSNAVTIGSRVRVTKVQG